MSNLIVSPYFMQKKICINFWIVKFIRGIIQFMLQEICNDSVFLHNIFIPTRTHVSKHENSLELF